MTDGEMDVFTKIKMIKRNLKEMRSRALDSANKISELRRFLIQQGFLYISKLHFEDVNKMNFDNYNSEAATRAAVLQISR